MKINLLTGEDLWTLSILGSYISLYSKSLKIVIRGQMGKYNPEVAALMKFKQYINDHLMIL
jgi:hypothetical protein